MPPPPSDAPDSTDAPDSADSTDAPEDRPIAADEDLTAVARELFQLPFHEVHDIRIEAATAEWARLRIPYDESLVGNVEVGAVHGGVISALADVTGSVPFVAAAGAYTPTVDLRVDYLSHAGAADLIAESTVRRRGDTLGVADVVVRSGGERCATGKGVYKLGEP